jgi:HTH-type transcriptional regulator/antitoxin HigA
MSRTPQDTITHAEVFPPGETIRQEMEARDWGQVDLAAILQRPVQAVNEILLGKKAITPETAKALGAAFGVPPEFWLKLEWMYRLSLVGDPSDAVARRARLYQFVPVREVVKRGWISGSDDLNTLEKEVHSFLEMPPGAEKPVPRFAARKSGSSDNYDFHTPAQIAWHYRCRHIARTQKTIAPYKPDLLGKAAESFRRQSLSDSSIAAVPETLAKLGVRVVALEHLPGSKIDGMAFWLDERSPVVAMTTRLDRVDNFFQTLMHEIVHILEGFDAEEHFDIDLTGAGEKPSREREADRKAAEWLVPPALLAQFITDRKSGFTQTAIVNFAAQVGVHPGVVVGQLHHRHAIHGDAIHWSYHRKLLTKVRHLLPLEK